MSTETPPYVFDSGPLSHFAQAGWMGLLKSFVGTAEAWLPDTVQRELADGADRHPHLRSVLDADWLTLRGIVTPEEHSALGNYTSRLMGDDPRKNLGECGVLALAQAHRAVAVIDDGAARTVAREFGVYTKTTVGLLVDLVAAKSLALDLAEDVADHLLQTDYNLPFGPGEFRRFVLENGLVPYE